MGYGGFAPSGLPPHWAQSLDALQLQQREPFGVCRRKTPAGVEYLEVQTSAKSVTSRDLATTPTGTPPSERREMGKAQDMAGHTRASSVMGAALIAAIDAASLAKSMPARRASPSSSARRT